MVCTFGLVLAFANTYGSIIGIIVNEFNYHDTNIVKFHSIFEKM